MQESSGLDRRHAAMLVVAYKKKGLDFGQIAEKLSMPRHMVNNIFTREKMKQEREHPHSLARLGLSTALLTIVSEVLRPKRRMRGDPDISKELEAGGIPKLGRYDIPTAEMFRKFIAEHPDWERIFAEHPGCGPRLMMRLRGFVQKHGLDKPN